MRVLIYGCGYSAEVWARRLLARGDRVAGTSRSPGRRAVLAGAGVRAVDPGDEDALSAAAFAADAVLVSAPPDPGGCPGLRALTPALAAGTPRRLVYLSTTGVYGDRSGGWVDEDSALEARSAEAVRRVGAESDWRALARDHDLALAVLRLPGLYGPGRSPFERLRAGRATRLSKPGQVFSRLHVDDLADALTLWLDAPAGPGRMAVYNVCDDRPAAPEAVTAHAARLLGVEPPPLEPFDAERLSPMARRFWGEAKRVSNARIKAALGWRPAHPTYVEGLAAVLEAEAASA